MCDLRRDFPPSWSYRLSCGGRLAQPPRVKARLMQCNNAGQRAAQSWAQARGPRWPVHRAHNRAVVPPSSPAFPADREAQGSLSPPLPRSASFSSQWLQGTVRGHHLSFSLSAWQSTSPSFVTSPLAAKLPLEAGTLSWRPSYCFIWHLFVW